MIYKVYITEFSTSVTKIESIKEKILVFMLTSRMAASEDQKVFNASIPKYDIITYKRDTLDVNLGNIRDIRLIKFPYRSLYI